MAMTILRATENRPVSAFSSDHAQSIAAKISALGVHVHSSRKRTVERGARFKSQSSACFRA